MADVDSLYQMASEYLAAVTDALLTTDAGLPDLEGVAVVPFVSPSLPSLDCPAQVTVHVQTIGMENTSPSTPLTDLGHRAATRFMVIATFVATVVRCQPTPAGIDAILPPSADIEAAARRSLQDVWAIWNMLSTRARNGAIFSTPCAPLYIDTPVPVTPQGASAGWAFQIRAQIDGYTV